MKKAILICCLSFFMMSSMVGQSFLAKPFEDIIVLRPFGLLSLLDPGVEVDYYHYTSSDNVLVGGYKFASSDLDIAWDLYENWWSHTLHGSVLFPIPLGDDYNFFYMYGPKLELSTRKYLKSYNNPVNNGEYFELKTAVLKSRTAKLIFAQELTILTESWFVFSIGIDLGFTFRTSYTDHPDAFQLDFLEPDIGYSTEGDFFIPHGKFRMGFGIKL